MNNLSPYHLAHISEIVIKQNKPHTTIDEIVADLKRVAHAFGEGNTPTMAVFTIKYLRIFGFEVENDLFAKYSWYFRNALVRANHNDYLSLINEFQTTVLYGNDTSND